MPTPVTEQVIAKIITTLEALRTLTGVPEMHDLLVERNRDTEVSHFPTIVVVDGNWDPDEDSFHGATVYTMEVGVECYLQAETHAELGRKMSVFHAEVVKAMLADVTLGGLTQNVTELAGFRDLDRTAGRTPQGGISVNFAVSYWTESGDPYTTAG